MKVLRSNILGFCMGVRAAVKISYALPTKSLNKVYTLGHLIHNPRVLEELKNRGIEVLDIKTAEDLPLDLSGSAVIIRAHGVAPNLERAICERGGRIVDATCPRVKKSQLIAQDFENNGFQLFIAGESGHAEIAGLAGYAPSCIIIGNTAEAEIAAKNLYESNSSANPQVKTALIAQTTIDEHEYREIGQVILKYFPTLEIIQTICPATTERQNSLRELLKKVDAVIIAGGKESANTRRLSLIAAESEKPYVLAESVSDIPKEFTAYNTIGLCAGASTPDSLIDEIEEKLKEPNNA